MLFVLPSFLFPQDRIFIDFVYKIAQLKKIKNKNLFFKK